MRFALALAAVVASTGSLPPAGTLVPGTSLGGVRLGETAAQTRAALGSFYGVCDGCGRTTWYFTYAKWTRAGLAVELRAGRVSAVYTVWRPHGWRTSAGLGFGTPGTTVRTRVPSLLPVGCPGYRALVTDTRTTRTVYYLAGGRLWGFGLMRANANPCR